MLATQQASRDAEQRNANPQNAAPTPPEEQRVESPDVEAQVVEVQNLLKRAREFGKLEMRLADQLNVGVAWWLRARFGWGDDLAGMGKSMASMSASPHNLAWQGYPTAAPSENQGPDYYVSPRLARRHHYYWTVAEVVAYPRSRTPGRRDTASRDSSQPSKSFPSQGSASRGIVRVVRSAGRGAAQAFVSGGQGQLMQFTLADRGNNWHGFSNYASQANRQSFQLPSYWPTAPNSPNPASGYNQEAVDELIAKYRENAPSYRTTPDAQLLPRLVGFYEYQAALACFEAIVLTSRAGHLDAIQSWLENAEELPVDVEINLWTEIVHPASSLDPAASKQLRRGLPWMMALAHVELGAMMSAFTDSAAPFAFHNLKDFGRDAYANLLLDALRTHFWSLQADLKKPPMDNALLQYRRRIRLLGQLLEAVTQVCPLSALQRQELLQWSVALSKAT